MKKYWDLVEPIWEAVSIYDGGDLFLNQLSKVSRKQKVLLCAHWATSEICNGGFHQFFSNSTGVLAPEAIEAFQVIGMPKASATIAEAIKFFGVSYDRDRDCRNEKLDEYECENEENWNPFEALDDIFFDSIETESGGFENAANNYAQNG